MASQVKGSAGGFDHAALLYRTPEEFASTIRGFVQAGVRAGEPVLVAATGPNLRLLRAELDGQGELVTWVDMSAAGINPRRVTAAMRLFAEGHHGRRVRCVQEPAWHARPPGEMREAIRHEALVSRAMSGMAAALLCAYDARLDPAVLASAERTHPTVIERGRWLPSPAYAAGLELPDNLDEPLGLPPPHASRISYREDQAGVRHFAAERATEAGLPLERVRDLVIAVGELAGNTLVHTAAPGTLAMWTADGELISEVRDTGQIRDMLAGAVLPGPAARGGRGLWVVHQLCDLVEMRTGADGTAIRLHMRLPADPDDH